MLLYSGSEQHYYADDRGIAFQAYGHFLHWIDVNRPGQMLCIRPGHKPVYYQVVPDDYWYEQDIVSDPAWGDCFEVVRLTSETALIEQIAGNYVFLGNNRALAEALGVPVLSAILRRCWLASIISAPTKPTMNWINFGSRTGWLWLVTAQLESAFWREARNMTSIWPTSRPAVFWKTKPLHEHCRAERKSGYPALSEQAPAASGWQPGVID